VLRWAWYAPTSTQAITLYVKDISSQSGSARSVKKGDPRVYLIDLTQDKVVYRSVMVDLPDDVPNFNDREKKQTWGPAVLRAIERLKERSPEVGQFLTPTRGE
jgi:hypothetical protein